MGIDWFLIQPVRSLCNEASQQHKWRFRCFHTIQMGWCMVFMHTMAIFSLHFVYGFSYGSVYHLSVNKNYVYLG